MATNIPEKFKIIYWNVLKKESTLHKTKGAIKVIKKYN